MLLHAMRYHQLFTVSNGVLNAIWLIRDPPYEMQLRIIFPGEEKEKQLSIGSHSPFVKGSSPGTNHLHFWVVYGLAWNRFLWCLTLRCQQRHPRVEGKVCLAQDWGKAPSGCTCTSRSEPMQYWLSGLWLDWETEKLRRSEMVHKLSP